MKKFSKLFEKKSMYNNVLETASTEELSIGHGRRFPVSTMLVNKENPIPTDMAYKCIFDVSVNGIRIVDPDDQALLTFDLRYIKDRKLDESSGTEPNLTFSFVHGIIRQYVQINAPLAALMNAAIDDAIKLREKQIRSNNDE